MKSKLLSNIAGRREWAAEFGLPLIDLDRSSGS
jgi:hypothetical protein